MGIKVLSVAKGSPAARAGILPGEVLLSVNGEPVLDEIDYQALTQSSRLKLELQTPAGQIRLLTLHKPVSHSLGLQLDERIILKPRVCKNHCIFCFVDQMPANLRSTLYVKDDDWRLSLMMGNFVTLTNVDDQEFERILRRKASPLYISVHATDPETRIRMLRNPSAGNLLERLKRMKEAGLKFHCQIVLCPEINDGAILHQSIVDLANLFPAAQSLAVVPIGLTKYRDGLYPIRTFQPDEARKLLSDLELIQMYYQRTLGTRFVYAADELYSLAGLPVPSESAYEGYPQIENGIGMIRQLFEQCERVWAAQGPELLQRASEKPSSHVLIPTGFSALKSIQELADRYAPPGDLVEVFPVPNHFFGSSVTVTGLITGQDLLASLRHRKGDRILISRSMLRENEDVFLDDMTLDQVQDAVGIPVIPVKNDGEDFLHKLFGL